MMTEQEAVAYVERYTWSTTRLGLDRTVALLEALGNPHQHLKFVHVAGSNGKGSTCAMLAAVLQAAGYRTGLYTSPYIHHFRERMKVNGMDIPGKTLAEITERVQQIADAMEDHPSQFELVTAIAMMYFFQARCDIVVLEVGMGGALDATNVITAPEVAVITNVGLEHTEYLGHTLTEIARTKAGIIKTGCDAVCYDGHLEVQKVIQDVCRERRVRLHQADSHALKSLDFSLDGQTFRWRDQIFSLPLLGKHQIYNAAVVLKTVEVLRNRGWQISSKALQDGLSQTSWPARFEVLRREPIFILDGGHNLQCAQALIENIDAYLPRQKVTFLLGVLADKDWGGMLDLLVPYATDFFCVTPNNPRALSGEKLANQIVQKHSVPAICCANLKYAVHTAWNGGQPVIAFGSLYLAGNIRNIAASI